jgi:hypothetical protein
MNKVITNIAYNLAKKYAEGWKMHAEFHGYYGNGMSAEEWARCEQDLYLEEADAIYKQIKKDEQETST